MTPETGLSFFICEYDPDDGTNKDERRQSYKQKLNAMQYGPCNCIFRIAVIPIQIFSVHRRKSNKAYHYKYTQCKEQIADQPDPHPASFGKLEVNAFQFFRNAF